MGELHLDIYVERMKREYKVEVDVGQPRVNYREAITKRAEFDYLHKKQSGNHSNPAPTINILCTVCKQTNLEFELEDMYTNSLLQMPNHNDAYHNNTEPHLQVWSGPECNKCKHYQPFTILVIVSIFVLSYQNSFTGGQGQFGRVTGFIDVLEDAEPGETVRFVNNIVGNAIPPSFLPACEKGFKDAVNSGALIGHPVEVRFLMWYAYMELLYVLLNFMCSAQHVSFDHFLTFGRWSENSCRCQTLHHVSTRRRWCLIMTLLPNTLQLSASSR